MAEMAKTLKPVRCQQNGFEYDMKTGEIYSNKWVFIYNLIFVFFDYYLL